MDIGFTKMAFLKTLTLFTIHRPVQVALRQTNSISNGYHSNFLERVVTVSWLKYDNKKLLTLSK